MKHEIFNQTIKINAMIKTKFFTLIILCCATFSNVKSQSKSSALILDFQTEKLFATPTLAGNIVRIELDKTKKYNLYDRNDIADKLGSSGIKIDDCYSATCVTEAGKIAGTDKVFTGSMLMLGNKIVITIKLFDVATGKLEQTQVEEFINIESELQNMVHITILKMHGETPDKMLLETLCYYQNISDLPTTKINNNGPRMGMAYMGGDMAERFRAVESEGGYEAYPLISQIGYQLEAQYLSAGNLQALAEFLIMFGGLDQQLFIPSLVILNGFRLNNSGWEIAFGPSFGMTKVALGYYDNTGHWNLGPSPISFNQETSQNEPIYTTIGNLDYRGNYKLTSSWVWAFGKTFRSGYLNIPVNAYFSRNKNGWYTGLSFGFNIRKKEQKMTVIR